MEHAGKDGEALIPLAVIRRWCRRRTVRVSAPGADEFAAVVRDPVRLCRALLRHDVIALLVHDRGRGLYARHFRRDIHVALGRRLDLDVRAGLHSGECELVDGKAGGIAVHIGARVASLAEPGEVLVSSTVKDLVAGSGIEFEDRGEHQLKGISESWHLYTVVP